MNSFFKGLTRGLLAVIPICLIVCVLFAGQRLMLTDRTSVSSRNAGFDVDSVSAEQTVSDKRSSEDTALSPSDISAGGAGSRTEELHRTPSVRMIRPFLLTPITRLLQTIVPNPITYAIPTLLPQKPVLAFVGDMLFTEKHPVPLPSAGHFLHVQ